MMDVFSVQLTVLLALFIGNFVFGLLPALVLKLIGRTCRSNHASHKKNRVLTLFLYFGGGIFISVCFLNLLPKTREEFEEKYLQEERREIITNDPSSVQRVAPVSHKEHAENFPIPEFVVLCGFFSTYILQETLSSFFSLRKRTNSASEFVRRRFCSCAKRHTECSRTFKDEKAEQTLFGLKRNKSSVSTDVLGAAEPGTNNVCENVNAEQGDLLKSSIIKQPVPNYGTVTNATEPGIHDPGPVLTPPVLIATDGGIVIQRPSVSPEIHKFSITCFLTVIALSFQAVYQGIATGQLAETSINWTVLLVVCAEQFLITFAAGTVVFSSIDRMFNFLVYIGILSAMSSIGVSLTIFAKTYVENVPHAVPGTVNGIICGALLYVTFSELLRQNKSDTVHGLQKFSATALGAGLMAILQYISVL